MEISKFSSNSQVFQLNSPNNHVFPWYTQIIRFCFWYKRMCHLIWHMHSKSNWGAIWNGARIAKAPYEMTYACKLCEEAPSHMAHECKSNSYRQHLGAISYGACTKKTTETPYEMTHPNCIELICYLTCRLPLTFSPMRHFIWRHLLYKKRNLVIWVNHEKTWLLRKFNWKTWLLLIFFFLKISIIS